MVQKILRIGQTLDLSGLSRSALYAHVAATLFTKPVRISIRAVGWPETEVAAINRARIQGISDDQIRALVADLHQARMEAA